MLSPHVQPAPALAIKHHRPHATKRAVERYGVHPTAEQWRQAVLAIIEAAAGNGDQARLISRFGDVEQWVVPVAGVPIRLLYDPNAAQILTALPWWPNDIVPRRSWLSGQNEKCRP